MFRRHRLSILVLAFATAALASLIFADPNRRLSPVSERTTGPSSGRIADFSGVWMERQSANSLAAVEPPFQGAAAAQFKAVKPGYGPHATPDSQDPILTCLPPGVPRIMLLPFPMQIVQTRDEVLMIFEYDHFIRQIFTDGRGHVKDVDQTWMGDSVGRWEGSTLVVDTTGLNDKTWLDQVGHPHSSSLHVVERLQRTDHNTLQDDITIDDPKDYAKPWTGKQTFLLKPDWNLAEYVCEDNMNFLDYHRKEVGGGNR